MSTKLRHIHIHSRGLALDPTERPIFTALIMVNLPTLELPPHSDEVKVSFPAERVLLLTLNRPKSLNAMTPQMEKDINNVLNWFENEPSLWCVLYHTFGCRPQDSILFNGLERVSIVTGEGRAFCAGADLKA